MYCEGCNFATQACFLLEIANPGIFEKISPGALIFQNFDSISQYILIDDAIKYTKNYHMNNDSKKMFKKYHKLPIF